MLAVLLLCVFLLGGCSGKGYFISKREVYGLISTLESPSTRYDLSDYFSATDVLDAYFNGENIEKSTAKEAYQLVYEYVDRMLDAEDEVLSALINLE